MPFIPREESLRRLRQTVAEGRPIIGAGAGSTIIDADDLDRQVCRTRGRRHHHHL